MADTTRRGFLRRGLAAGAALTLPGAARPAPPPGSRAVAPGQLRKFAQPVPVPGAGIVVAAPSGPGRYAFTQRQIHRQLHPQLPPTPVWAYDDGRGLAGQAGSFGMALAARSGVPLDVSFTSDLPAAYPGWLPADPRLTAYGRQVRTLTHLHGGFTAAASDGNPAADPAGYGRGQTQHAHYPNPLPQMPASLRWFHDHADGLHRLNLVAGLAAAYILRDEHDTGGEPNPIGVPGGRYDIPLVLQDRQFSSDGRFRYPVSTIPGLVWIGEYFGDHMLVNGKVWPYLDAEPRMYRLRFLNACNARIMSLSLGGLPMWQIGADGGLFDRPVPVRRLVLAPAERADVLADFRGLAGRTVQVTNSRPAAPVSTPAPDLPDVMQIRVGWHVTRPGPRRVPASLPGTMPRLPRPARTRYLPLNELAPGTPAWAMNLDGRPADAMPVTESPRAGSIEDWAYMNLTDDSHPMHLHLVTFQVIGRTPFDAAACRQAHGGPRGVPAGIDPAPFVTGPRRPPGPTERGWKDTVRADPGYVTTIRARFGLPAGVLPPQTYMHHCHIAEHSDKGMMRPFTVIP